MKTIVLEKNRLDESDCRISWHFIPDSALANAGKPFFIPEFAEEFEAVIAPVFRISRLGKSIGARFAPRYCHEMAPAVHFRAPHLCDSLLSAHRNPDMAYGFDRSLIVGRFMELDDICEPPVLTMTADGMPVAEWRAGDFRLSPAQAIEAVSAANTLKTGDLIVSGMSQPVAIAIGERLEIKKGEESLLRIAIR